MEFHPLADLFPLMSEAELDALGNDMLANGQRESIALFEEKILDGRNRYLACMRNGIEPRFINQRPADPVAFVASANLHRRHLDPSQRAMIAARLATMKRGDNQHTTKGRTSQAEAAELLDVGMRSVGRAREVIDHAVPELIDAVNRRDVPVKAAAEFVRDYPPSEQSKLIAKAGSPAAAVESAMLLKRTQSDIDAAADRAAAGPAKVSPDVSEEADLAEQQSKRKAEQRRVSEGVMRTLDLFDRPKVDPADRAEEIIEYFNLAIAEDSGSGKFSIARIHRVITAMSLVFAAITVELEQERAP